MRQCCKLKHSWVMMMTSTAVSLNATPIIVEAVTLVAFEADIVAPSVWPPKLGVERHHAQLFALLLHDLIRLSSNNPSHLPDNLTLSTLI